tara:strand:- start:2297 stop:2647 length:351 start_codon:yes stop_codon:yes gene_type:complete
MINYVQAFVASENRKPTPSELGRMMVLVTGRETDRHKHEKKSLIHSRNGQCYVRQDNVGGRKRTKLQLSDNAKKINGLLWKGFDNKTIALILDLKINTVRSLKRKNALPRKPSEIE